MSLTKVLETDDRNLWLGQCDRPYSLSSPFGGQEFALMLVVVETNITDDERDVLSSEMIELGCRYAVCTGEQCSRWDDSIDFAFLATSPDFSPPDGRWVAGAPC